MFDHMWTMFEHIRIIFRSYSNVFEHIRTNLAGRWPGGWAGGLRAGKEGKEGIFFCACIKTKKTRTAHTIILPAVSRRDLCYVSENNRFRFYNIPTTLGTFAPSINKRWRRRLLSPDEFKKVRSRKRTAPRRIANRKQTGFSNLFEPQFAIRNSIRIADTSGHYGGGVVGRA